MVTFTQQLVTSLPVGQPWLQQVYQIYGWATERTLPKIVSPFSCALCNDKEVASSSIQPGQRPQWEGTWCVSLGGSTKSSMELMFSLYINQPGNCLAIDVHPTLRGSPVLSHSSQLNKTTARKKGTNLG